MDALPKPAVQLFEIVQDFSCSRRPDESRASALIPRQIEEGRGQPCIGCGSPEIHVPWFDFYFLHCQPLSLLQTAILSIL